MFAVNFTLLSPRLRASAVHFVNSDVCADLVSFTNDLAVGPDGWAQLAPFGDFPGRAMLRQPDGSVKTFDAIQRLDRAAAEGMTAKFKSIGQRLKRFITGCHIYIGHPDVPAFANDYPDKSPKGMIVDLAVRDDGLYCKPVFTNEGSELVESKTYRAFSGYWSAQPVGEENGKTIFRPDHLKSAGLTNRPNLPVQLMNETPAAAACSFSSGAEPPTHPVLRTLLPWFAWHGVALSPEATAGQVEAALAQLETRFEPPTSANAQPGRAGASASQSTPAPDSPEAPPSPSSSGDASGPAAEGTGRAFANERQARITAILDLAIATGRITAAQRPDWAARLAVEANFANELDVLEKAAPVLKTRGLTADMGSRKVEIANAADRHEAVQNLLRAELPKHAGNYDRAFAAVRKANPALFEAMQQPAVAK